MPEHREYKIDIDPRILDLLGPSLYTNIYHVLAELIANSYDASASNVYIIKKEDRIIVEDDGDGMSYESGDITKYLRVAVETRTTEAESYTADGRRRKIGRKGVGKLAALSVSEHVHVLTVKDGEKSGFVLSRHVGADHLLTPIAEEEIRFEQVTDNGTAIVMTNPQYGMHTTPSAIKNNLLKIFPLVDAKFRIHIITPSGTIMVDSFDREMIQHLVALIALGDEFHDLAQHFDSKLEPRDEIEKRLLSLEDAKTATLALRTRQGETKLFNIEIKGWVGAYRSTKGRKSNLTDFPDNFISLIANSKLGEYNILPVVGKNRLSEMYVVGQLHIDLFEETELPDMALSNRQGYKTDDERYGFVIETVRDDLLPRIIAMRDLFADYQRKHKTDEKRQLLLRAEEELRNKVEEYKSSASRVAADRISKQLEQGSRGNIQEIIKTEMNQALPIIGLKSKVDSQKKRVLICHTKADKDLANVVYRMMAFNGVEDEDIIYTSCENAAARIPEEAGVFNYLREFFVNSYSTEKILVLYITSENMSRSWGAVTEVGAGWITRMDHKIFNLQGYRPQLPLNIENEWQTSIKDDDGIKMEPVEFDKFIVKIQSACQKVGVEPKAMEANKRELRRYVNEAV